MRWFFKRLDHRARRRLWLMYHVLFVLLLGHLALVYLFPGYFENPQRHVRGLTGAGFHGDRPASHIIEREDQVRLLYGGDDEAMHFDITTFRLNLDQLHYGLGREVFPALIEPKFDSLSEADKWLNPEDRVLAVSIGEEVRVYPIGLLTHHEVVNDVVGGVPIFAAYCILADLGAVYERRLGEHTLTFALSGYTYADPDVWDGRDAFVLWDRETESLWWPPIGKAVSGPLIEQPLRVLDEAYWTQTTWEQVKGKHPEALVLQRGQDFERPTEWPRLEHPPERLGAESPSDRAIAPRWGRNASW